MFEVNTGIFLTDTWQPNPSTFYLFFLISDIFSLEHIKMEQLPIYLKRIMYYSLTTNMPFRVTFLSCFFFHVVVTLLNVYES